MVAGVCGGLSRATGADPLLFRVLFGVLAFFGGAGILIYLAAWLLLPLEGDEASPVESLLTRKRSSTSPVVVILLIVAAVLLTGLVFNDGPRAPLLVVASVVGLALLWWRNQTTGGAFLAPQAPAHPAPPPPMHPTVPPPPFADGPGHGAQPTGMPVGGSPTALTKEGNVPTTGQETPRPEDGTGDGSTGTTAQTSAAQHGDPTTNLLKSPVLAGRPDRGPSGTTVFDSPIPPAGPFAPHGPYGAVPPPGAWAPPAPLPGAAPPPARQRERSLLSRLTLSLVLIALGLVALVDIAGLSIPGPAYLAVALTIVALGLITGSVIGRPRGLAPIGVVLAVLLVLSAAAGRSDVGERFDGGSNTTWRPTSISDLQTSYQSGAGSTTLDLTEVDFSGADRTIDLSVAAGELEVRLPLEVNATIHVQMGLGEALIFDQQFNGLDIDQTVQDNGQLDGGRVTVNIETGAGSVEVTR